MKKTHLLILGSLCLVLLIASLATFAYVSSVKDAPNSEARTDLATNAQQQFIGLNGNEVDLTAYKGQIRVVYLWASWSPFSTDDLRSLEGIASDYAQRNVAVIAMDRKESKEDADRFLKTLGDLPHLAFTIDVNDTYYKSIGGYAMPELIIYDAKGNVALHVRGEIKADEIREMLDKLAAVKQ